MVRSIEGYLGGKGQKQVLERKHYTKSHPKLPVSSYQRANGHHDSYPLHLLFITVHSQPSSKELYSETLALFKAHPGRASHG